MKLGIYLSLLAKAESTLAESFRQVAAGHGHEPDVHFICQTLADQCDEHCRSLQPMLEQYGRGNVDDEPEALHAQGLGQTRSGPLGLLRDLQDLYILGSFVDITWMMVKQVGQGLRDARLLESVATCEQESAKQLRWLSTRMKQAAPQALLISP